MRRTKVLGITGGLLVLALLATACSGSESFRGTALDTPDTAPPFQLRDQFGQAVSLSDYLGKPVVLTFLYTSCPDICPIVTETLHRTHVLLGSDAEEVEFLAISVDPARDSIEKIHEYSKDRDMQDRWRFLTGTEEELKSVWKLYWLAPIRGRSNSDEYQDGEGSPDEDIEIELDEGLDQALANHAEGYLVGHTAPVFLIDRKGYRRAVFTNLSLDPIPLVHDIRMLLG